MADFDIIRLTTGGNLGDVLENDGNDGMVWVSPNGLPIGVHTHTLSDITDAGTAAASDVGDFATAAQGALADSAVQVADIDTLAEVNAIITDATLIDTGDPRLSDARTPTAHTHTLADITDSGTAAPLDVPAAGDAAAGEVVKGDDTRLTDARTPAAHVHDGSDITSGQIGDGYISQSSVTQHENALTITESQISDLNHTVEVNDLTAAVVWANVPDANVPESAVTQHEAALTITESQISDLSHTPDFGYTSQAGNYTVLATDDFVRSTGAGSTITLPTAVGDAGKIFTIKNDSGGNITVDTTGAETMDGDLTVALLDKEALAVFSDGANYQIH